MSSLETISVDCGCSSVLISRQLPVTLLNKYTWQLAPADWHKDAHWNFLATKVSCISKIDRVGDCKLIFLKIVVVPG